MIWVGNTGNLVRGSVLDMGRSTIEEKLRDYDHLLYVRWNPKKRQGRGIWEVRRLPEKKTRVHRGNWNGISFFELAYQEMDLINHVLDVPVLDHSVITKIKSMDIWAKGAKNWVDTLEGYEADYRNKKNEKARKDMLYAGKQYKKEIKDFKEMILSGLNPHLIANHWDDKKK